MGSSDEIFRFNLEQGRFQTTLRTSTGAEMNCCEFNPAHELFTCGSTDGLVECWDPRAPSTVKPIGLLNCNVDELFENGGGKCAITALKYRDGLNLAVGTSTGHVLLYDIRSSRPLLVKDHRYELPIKDVQWHKQTDLVVSIDKRACKIWDRNTVTKSFYLSTKLFFFKVNQLNTFKGKTVHFDRARNRAEQRLPGARQRHDFHGQRGAQNTRLLYTCLLYTSRRG